MERRLKFAVLIAFAAFVAAACATIGSRDPVVVQLVSTANGDQIVVDGQQVALDAVDDVVIMQAMAADPGMTTDEARREARVLVSAEPTVLYALMQDVLLRLREFENISIVTEGRR